MPKPFNGCTTFVMVLYTTWNGKYLGLQSVCEPSCSSFVFRSLKITLSKNIQALPSEKRDGMTIVKSALRELTFDSHKSLSLAYDLLSRDAHDPRVLEHLQAKPQEVVKQLEEFRAYVTNPGSMRICVAGDIAGLPEPKSTWAKHFGSSPASTELSPVVLGSDVLSALGQNPKKKALVYSMASIESSFSTHATKAPAGFDHPDRPALAVVCGVMNALESYLWKNIRGAGLAYGASIRDVPERGLILFTCYRSPDAAKAFEAAKKIVDDLASGKAEIETVTLESAKSSLAFTTAQGEGNIASAATSSFFSQAMIGMPQSYARDILAKAAVCAQFPFASFFTPCSFPASLIQDVTAEDCVRVLQQYIQPLFNPETSIAAVAASKTLADTIGSSLEKLGFEPEIRTIEAGDDSMSEDESGSESGSESE